MDTLRIQIPFLLIFVIAGCATQRTSLPEIEEPPRTGLNLETPVLFSIIDARTNKENSEEHIETLKRGLHNTYSNSVEWFDYFERIPEDRVAIRIRLNANEANFGSRIITETGIHNSISNTQATVSGFWNPIVVMASNQQSILSSNIATEGWWIGTSWLELELVDRRGGNDESFSFPIAAEHRESNTLGYRSANNAVNRSWSLASQHLIEIFDKILIAVRDQE